MTIKLRKKDITNQFRYILEFGYCEIQWIESYLDKLGYTCGTYGWNADIYYINNDMCLVTGYRPFGNLDGSKLFKNISLDIGEFFKDNDDFNCRKNFIKMLFNKIYLELKE